MMMMMMMIVRGSLDLGAAHTWRDHPQPGRDAEQAEWGEVQGAGAQGESQRGGGGKVGYVMMFCYLEWIFGCRLLRT